MANYIENARKILANELLPGTLEKELLDLYTLLVFSKGSNVTCKDVHDAWSIWRERTNSGHKSLVPYDELTKDVQDLDLPYMDAIRRTAKQIVR